jgi:hypothetical protein
MFLPGQGVIKMLKTAILTLGFCALGSGALAVETPKFDRKIERAAIERVAAKMGGLRETLAEEIKVAAADIAALPVELDLAPTATVLVQPNEPRFPKPVEVKNFRIIAGEYNR